jgi:transposase InsO family protein
MTDGYNCYQYAPAKRGNGLLNEELLLQRSANLEQARHMVRKSVHIYNSERLHLSRKSDLQIRCIGRPWQAYTDLFYRPKCQPNSGLGTCNA